MINESGQGEVFAAELKMGFPHRLTLSGRVAVKIHPCQDASTLTVQRKQGRRNHELGNDCGHARLLQQPRPTARCKTAGCASWSRQPGSSQLLLCSCFCSLCTPRRERRFLRVQSMQKITHASKCRLVVVAHHGQPRGGRRTAKLHIFDNMRLSKTS